MSEITSANNVKGGHRHSLSHLIRFSLIRGITESFGAIVSVHLFYFYENIMFLDIAIVSAAVMFFGIWDGINDPIIGWMSDRGIFVKKFWRTYGRRAIWIALGIFPLIVTFFLLWVPPVSQEWIIGAYLFIMLILYELFWTMTGTNQYALIPEKFELESERNRFAIILQIVTILFIFVGQLLPSFIISVENPGRSDYITVGLIMVGIGVVLAVIAFPSIKEDEHMRERSIKYEHVSFFNSLGKAMKHRNFLMLSLISIFQALQLGLFTASLYYWLGFAVIDGSADSVILIMIAFFTLALLSLILWKIITDKVGAKNSYLFGLIGAMIACIFFFLIRSFTGALIGTAIMGISYGSIFLNTQLLFSDTCDDYALKYSVRSEGCLTGVWSFITRASTVLQAAIFWIVHKITNYQEGVPGDVVQSPEAIEGIVAMVSWIPGIVLLIGIILFWRFYSLDLKRTREMKAQLYASNSL